MNDFYDVRWKQRFSNYKKALSQLTEFIEHGELNKFEEQGFIKAFEYTYELAWNTLKDFLEYQGDSGIIGSRDAFRKAFSAGIIADGKVWMNMLKSRNKTTHTYNEVTAKEISDTVRDDYYQLFCDLEKSLDARMED